MKKILPALLLFPLPLHAFTFEALEGGTIDLDGFRGGPVLVVNTASLCGFTDQYGGLQALQDRYGDQGLTVLGVPSDQFAQELDNDTEVATFCEVNYGLTIPLTTITPVRGPDAHPFYRWLADTHGVSPRWNFNKALLDAEGNLVGFFGATTTPASLAPEIEAVLAQ